MLLGLALLGTGVYFATRDHGADCIRALKWPIIILGAAMSIVALVGFLGALNGSSALLWLYCLAMFLLVLALAALTVFSFLVTNSKAEQIVSGRGYKQYKTSDFSDWLQKQVNNTGRWKKIKACILDSKTCSKLDNKYPTFALLAVAKLSSVQSGCCMPPAACGFTFINATDWSTDGAAASNNTDCSTWSNSQDELCYDCNTCKAGALHLIQKDWRLVAYVNLAILALIIVLYSVGCCAYRSARRGERSGYAKGFA
eukprot:SM000062S19866  [mRNA]  locus=s62:102197:103681:+ [translate_table: standard]